MIMISWGRSKPVIGQALNMGSSFSGLSLTAVESTPTFCTKRYQRGPCGRSGTSTWILWLDLEVPWFRTLPPGREYAFKNRLLPCSSGTLEWIMFSFAWTGNAAGAKDAMCSAFAKRLWLGVLLVTITSARPTLQGTELKKKWNPKCDSMWWNFCDFCLPLTRYTWFIYLMLWSICVTIWTLTSTNCITDQMLLLLISLMTPRV